MTNVGKKDVPASKAVKAEKVKGAKADAGGKSKGKAPPLSKIKGGAAC